MTKKLRRGAGALVSLPYPRLSVLRDLHYTLRDALDDPGYVKSFGGPLATADTICTAIDAAMLSELRLKTPPQLIAWFLSDPRAELARLAPELYRRLDAFRKGRRAGRVAWHDVVRGLVEQENLPFTKVWARLRQLAEKDHDVIVDVVANNTNKACAEVPGRAHPERHHVHWRDRTRDDRVFAVGAGTVKNFVSKVRSGSSAVSSK